MFPNFIRKQNIFLQLLVTLTSTKSPLLGTGRRRDPIGAPGLPRRPHGSARRPHARCRPARRSLPPPAALPPLSAARSAPVPCAAGGSTRRPAACGLRAHLFAWSSLRRAVATRHIPLSVTHCISPPIATDWYCYSFSLLQLQSAD